MEGKIKIKLYRSPICTPVKHKLVVKGLGLRSCSIRFEPIGRVW